MQFPHAYHGVKRLIGTEIPIGMLIVFTILFPLGLGSGTLAAPVVTLLTCTVLILGGAATLVRLLSLNRAAIDADAFRTAGIKSVIAFGLFANNFTLLPIVVKWCQELCAAKKIPQLDLLSGGTACLPYVMQITALLFFLYAASAVIDGIDAISIKLRDMVIYDLGQSVRKLYKYLFCVSLLSAILNVALPEKIVSDYPFRVSAGVVLLGCVLYLWFQNYSYVKQAEEMLLQAKIPEKTDWAGVARELVPEELEDEEIAVAVRPVADRSKWADEVSWTGVARELMPEDPTGKVIPVPVSPASVRSKWADDENRFFRNPFSSPFEKSEAEQCALAGTYLCVKRLFAAEVLCLVTILSVLFFSDTSSALSGMRIPVFPWFASLFGKIVCFRQWRSMRRAASDGPTFSYGARVLERALWAVYAIIVLPVLFMVFFVQPDLAFFDLISFILRILWVIIPIQVTLIIISHIRTLARQIKDWDLASRWQKRHRQLFFLLYPLTGCFFVIVIAGLSLPRIEPIIYSLAWTVVYAGSAALVWFWCVFLRDLYRLRKRLLLVKNDDQIRYSNAPIEAPTGE